MNSSDIAIDNWLIESMPLNDNYAGIEGWSPLFDADRHLVHIRFGPFWRLYIRPKHFIKRFYHKVYPLPVEHWSTSQQIKLYDGFCTMDVKLQIRFQATLQYAQANMEALSNINHHIKTVYNELILNLLEQELFKLTDGRWIQRGVSEIEKKIAVGVDEMLVVQQIQSQTLCLIKPTFSEFPDVQLAQKNVYLCVLKESFEFNNAKREELFRQEQEIEKQRLEHKRALLEKFRSEAELERQLQAQEASNKKLFLEEQIKQLNKQFEIEKQLHIEKLKHEKTLKEISLEADIQAQEKKEARLRVAAEKNQLAILAHQNKMKERELNADIEHYEKHETRWRQIKDKLQQLDNEKNGFERSFQRSRKKN